MLDTMPMALDAPHEAGALDDFRIGAQREVVAMLKSLCDANARLQRHSADGGSLDATLWTVDPDRRAIGFNFDADATGLQSMLDGRALVVVGSLESVKVQFELDAPVLVRSVATSVLQGALPRVLYRFQRRSAYRVRLALALRVLDVSLGGYALFLPHDRNAAFREPGAGHRFARGAANERVRDRPSHHGVGGADRLAAGLADAAGAVRLGARTDARTLK